MAGGEIRLINQALTGLARRQAAIANNVANAETPGYQRADVPFERVLREQLSAQGAATRGVPTGRTGNGGPLPLTGASDSERSGLAKQLAGLDLPSIETAPRNDGNTVDMDQEMTALAETQLRYAGLSSALTTRLRNLRAVAENF